jgi:hypothetical protein
VNGYPPFDAAERIESIKAGTLAALSLSLAYSVTTLGNHVLLADLQSTWDFNLLVKVVIAGLSGLLFGITYRYIIRDDQNSHLNDGAVLAFGLVRGLAQVDTGLSLTATLWSLCVLGIESILLFAIARFTLDWAMQLGWIKPFRSS